MTLHDQHLVFKHIQIWIITFEYEIRMTLDRCHVVLLAYLNLHVATLNVTFVKF